MKGLIVTPTLGISAWLDTAVDSVQQYAPQARHILVAPADVVDDLARRFERSTVLVEPGGGMYAAINHAIRAVPDWKWMGYLNDDDRLESGFTSLVDATAFRSHDILYGRVSYIDAEGRDLGAFPVERCPRRFASLMTAGIPPFTQQGTVVSRACFERLRGFDTDYRLAADHDFWVRAVMSGASFRYLPADVGSFRLRAGQLSADQEEVKTELASIHARHLPSGNRGSAFFVRSGFRCRHLPSILRRRIRTGHWRTGASIWRVQA